MEMQPRKFAHTGAQRFTHQEGSSATSGQEDEELAHPAGYSTMARDQEDGPVIWEALPLHHEKEPVPGDPVTNPYGSTSVRARVLGEEEALTVMVGPSKGNRSEGAKECRESEGRKKSDDIGERQAPGPGRAKEARADVNLWGAT